MRPFQARRATAVGDGTALREGATGWARALVPAAVAVAAIGWSLEDLGYALVIATCWYVVWAYAERRVDYRFGYLLGAVSTPRTQPLRPSTGRHSAP